MAGDEAGQSLHGFESHSNETGLYDNEELLKHLKQQNHRIGFCFVVAVVRKVSLLLKIGVNEEIENC